MKKIPVLLWTLIFVLSFTACNTTANITDTDKNYETSEKTDSTQNESKSSRILIAYFSIPENVSTTDAVAGASIVVKDGERMGNTEYAAKLIQDTIGGDLFHIKTVESYPLEHEALVDQAADEQDDKKRPAISDIVEGFDEYDTMILGYPNWWADLPMPVYTFLESYDFSEKTIIPFVTHGGSGFSNTVKTIANLQPNAKISDNTLSISRNKIADCKEQVTEWALSLGLTAAEPPLEQNNDTVLSAIADPNNQQTLYLWEENNMPAVTVYTQNNGNYSDDPDFRPYVVTFPVPEGTPIKGSVLINAGGAFQYRSDRNEGTPVAEELSKRGYQSFVVNYRLRPYTQEEGALDLAHAVRFVRKNADVYGIDENDIAVMGFSAGGILAGELLLNYDGTVNGTALDPDYIPDTLDSISANASAAGMIYSFYGRLSIASADTEKFKAADLPPTYFCYGTRDPFVDQFEKCIAALQEAGVPVQTDVLDGRPHGYGYTEGWIPAYDQ